MIYIVLAVEALFDGVSFVLALRAFSAAKGDLGYWEAMTKSKDAPSFIVLAEDTAGLVGIAVAAAGTLLATSFDLPVADGVASVVVGLVLAFVGWVLVRESKGLLIGEQASSELSQSILALAESQDGVDGVNGVVATHLAPDQIVVTLSLEFSDELRTPEIEEAVQSLEERIRAKHPEVIALFVKPQSHSASGKPCCAPPQHRVYENCEGGLSSRRSAQRASQQLVGGKPALRRSLRDPFLSLGRIRAYAKFSHFRLDLVVVIPSGMAARPEKSAALNALDRAKKLRAVFGLQARPARSICRDRRHGSACKNAPRIRVCVR